MGGGVANHILNQRPNGFSIIVEMLGRLTVPGVKNAWKALGIQGEISQIFCIEV